MKVYVNCKSVGDRDHTCVEIPYRDHEISIAKGIMSKGGEILIFGPDGEILKDWEGNDFRLYGASGEQIKRAMKFIDYTLRDDE